MHILINGTPVAVGERLAADALDRAGLRPLSPWRRLFARGGVAGRRLEAWDCTVEAFDGAFSLYPCTHRYLDRDRRWRTAASIIIDRDRVRAVVLRVIEGRYAAAEFADRFGAACSAVAGEAEVIDRRTRRWRNGVATFFATLQRDRRNACFGIEAKD